MGLTPVAPDEVATVVTTLEMRTRPRPRPLPPSPLRLHRWDRPAPVAYRTLFARVGAPWLWYSRLAMAEARLAAVLRDPATAVFVAVDPAGVEVGLLEIDLSRAEVTEIAYLALIPELTGRGHGRWLMAHALAHAWRPGVERIRVRTCTLDHPKALGFYRAQGFTAASRTLETFPDPRVLGLLPPEAAPQVPMLAPVQAPPAGTPAAAT